MQIQYYNEDTHTKKYLQTKRYQKNRQVVQLGISWECRTKADMCNIYKKLIKIEKKTKEKSTKTSKGNIDWIKPNVYSRIYS